MALIRNVQPDLTELVGYVISRARDKRVTLNRARLVKLLYLVDAESVRTGREPVTGVRWMFLDHGPHAEELVEALGEMERRSALYRAASDDPPDAANWVSGARRSVDDVVERFAALPLHALLDHVYFHTGPMRAAVRGAALDLDRARGDASPRRAPALRAPARPDDVERRLVLWRASVARRLTALSLDPPPASLVEPGDDLRGARVTGRIDVPAACEL